MSALFKRPPGHHPLTRKLAIVTAIKLLVLMALWWAFFSGDGNGGRGAGMTPDQAAAAILHPKNGNSPK